MYKASRSKVLYASRILLENGTNPLESAGWPLMTNGFEMITERAIARRMYWVDEIVKLSGHFGQDSTRVETELKEEVRRDGASAVLDHLRLCGAIPEHYRHDSSEEKLYSKYTDMLLATAFRQMGLTSLVLTERGDAADVEAFAENYSLVADAKVFRLSRTAKNQKDFKIEAMHGWKRGKPHAMIVCPIYQLPTKASQIYQQSIARNVCIFSYGHLAVLIRLSEEVSQSSAQEILLAVLKSAESLNPIKDSVYYWTSLNRTMIAGHPKVLEFWQAEKVATVEALRVAKEEALVALARERESILKMSHEDAINQLITDRNLNGREKVIHAVSDSGILSIQ